MLKTCNQSRISYKKEKGMVREREKYVFKKVGGVIWGVSRGGREYNVKE
jgi:hypothetical protein